MTFRAKLNLRFYVVSALLLGLVLFVWFGVYFMNANEILMEDGTPMDTGTKTLFTVLMSIIALSWTLSLLTVLRQIILGAAFCMDEKGIHHTATAVMILAFIFVVPVKTIPYRAIKQVSDEDGILTINIDKSKIDVFPPLRLLARSEYRFFFGFTKEEQSEIKQQLEQFVGSN